MREILYFAAHGLNTGFVRIFYFPKRLHFNKITFPPQSPYSSQTGHGVAGMVIEKCSSPIGDGNFHLYRQSGIFQIEKCSSPIGDGKTDDEGYDILEEIEKCSSPIGDGNL